MPGKFKCKTSIAINKLGIIQCQNHELTTWQKYFAVLWSCAE